MVIQNDVHSCLGVEVFAWFWLPLSLPICTSKYGWVMRMVNADLSWVYIILPCVLFLGIWLITYYTLCNQFVQFRKVLHNSIFHRMLNQSLKLDTCQVINSNIWNCSIILICMCISMHVCMRVCVYVWCMCVCVCMC